jgi:hypothetical protein
VCFKDDQQEWEEWTLENSSRAKLVEESRLWFLAMKVPNDLAADNVQHALEATGEKLKEQKEIKRRNQFLNF